VLFIRPTDHASLGGGHHIDFTRPQAANEVSINGILVNV
jgi:hypothetical protein